VDQTKSFFITSARLRNILKLIQFLLFTFW
jgi:hypothetical protein